ncbi:MAG: helix-turn-helix transcriptional regulator [Deltaproteobacteria bacterium]|nr:helix-turn-helix transcriptional regulator [Deltaproteobacteria bacterium]
MKAEKWFRDTLESFKEDREFRLETIILNLTESICSKMIQKKINRSKLAELLGVSPAAITKILNGNSNFTLKTLFSLSDALGLDLEIDFREREKEVLIRKVPVAHYDVSPKRTTEIGDLTFTKEFMGEKSGIPTTDSCLPYIFKEKGFYPEHAS